MQVQEVRTEALAAIIVDALSRAPSRQPAAFPHDFLTPSISR